MRRKERNTAKGLFTCLHSTQTSSAYKLNARTRARLKNEWSKSLFELELELLHVFHLHAQQLLLFVSIPLKNEVHYLLSDNLHTNWNTIGLQQNPLKNTSMQNVSPGNRIKPFGDDSIISISIYVAQLIATVVIWCVCLLFSFFSIMRLKRKVKHNFCMLLFYFYCCQLIAIIIVHCTMYIDRRER